MYFEFSEVASFYFSINFVKHIQMLEIVKIPLKSKSYTSIITLVKLVHQNENVVNTCCTSNCKVMVN